MFKKLDFRISANPQAVFLPITDYITLAKKEIAYFCNRHYQSYKRQLLNDEDAIAMVAYANMLADWRYNPETHKSSAKTFRMAYAKGTIKNIIKHINKTNYKNQIPIDLLDDYFTDDNFPENAIIQTEEREIIQEGLDKLPARHSEIIRRHYLEQESVSDIAEDMGISRQRIYQIIETSLTALKQFKGELA